MLVVGPILVNATRRFRHGYLPTALVNASTQMQQSQVAKTAQVVVLQKGHGDRATGALALLQALPLVTSGSLGTQVNTIA